MIFLKHEPLYQRKTIHWLYDKSMASVLKETWTSMINQKGWKAKKSGTHYIVQNRSYAKN